MTSQALDIPDIQRRAARCVYKILNGAKPGALSIGLRTRFGLVNNLKTADAPT